ncbi:MAG TPA: TonB-dependent receptor [Xanthobacteraceae bacterium]
MAGHRRVRPQYRGGGSHSVIATLALAVGLAAPTQSKAQTANSSSTATTLPPVTVTAPRQRRPRPAKPNNVARRTPAVAPEPAPSTPTAQTAPIAGGASTPGHVTNPYSQAAQQPAGVSKTNTKLADLPASVQIIPHDIPAEQGVTGVTGLRDSIYNASGVNFGGQDSLGYFDHFLIRGLNAQIYSDGFSDGDQLGGLAHSLNGVKQIEILGGPGSALFGSGPPGGTINVVHFTPSNEFHWGDSVTAGSFGRIVNNGYVTGPTTVPGLSYRIDTTFSRDDGFRDLGSQDYEIRPDFTWQRGDHLFEFSLDARHIVQTPDSYGLIYFKGSPITGVPIDAKYSTPFANATSDYVRPTASDKWDVNEFLTINNRISYVYRTVDALRNGDSSNTKVDPTGAVVGRQLRQQDDVDNTVDYQFEPVWKFGTYGIGHTLLTGFEYVHQTMDTQRQTADLNPIPNAFAPVVPETSLGNIGPNGFQCDAKHSCDNDHLLANYYSLYATDQMDVTDRFKVRMGVRQDFWDTALTPLITVPTSPADPTPSRLTSAGVPLIAGVTQARQDNPVSWNVGALYKLFPGVSPYAGVSKSFLTNFNSENTQNGTGAPESALQYEAGIKFQMLNDRITLNTAAFDITRENVATVIAATETVVFDSQRTRGADVSLIAALTDRWSLLTNATYMHAFVTDAPQAIATVGNRPQGVPATMANLWTTYKFSIAGIQGFKAGIGVNYRGKTFSDTTDANWVPQYVIGNLMFGYDEDTWGIALNIKDFTNERYFIAANGAGGLVGEGLSAFVTIHVNH